MQQTAEYIYSLEQEKTRLLSQNCQLKRLLNQHEGGEVPFKKRKNEILPHVPSIIPDSTDDSITNSRSPEPVAVITVTSAPPKKEESGELRVQLESERRLRRLLEERLHALEGQLYPEAARETIHPVLFEQTELVGDCKVEDEEVEEMATEAPAGMVEVIPIVTPVAPVVPAAVGTPAPTAPLLEAAIKAEPRVEVEVLPDAAHDRLYLASTSRQNLETIVEAIRHLEGDHLFGEAGDAPLALTKKAPPPPRPGVIVVKHS